MALDDYDDLDAVGLAGRIAARDVSALDVLEAAISRLEERNPALNAIVDRLYDEARKTIAAGLPEGPLSGVPFLMKGLGLFMAGVRCTQGSRLFADFVADHDSTMVSRVRQAGLVVFGTTNSPEFGLNSTTEPAAHGPTHNPWNLAFSPGGSSGGSGAAVAARIVPAANASDGGGSIRIPASNCSLVGLKVSRGRTPSGPDAGEGWAGLANEHALTRTVRDSAAILDATHGPAPGDPYFAKAPERPFLDEVGRDPGKLRIALMTAPPDGRAVDDACVTETRKAATLCESLGHTIEEAGPAFDFEAMLQAIRVVVGGSVGFGTETRLHALDRELRQGDVENITKTWAEEGASYSARDFAEAVFTLHQVARDFGAFFEDYDVLLSPTLGRVPMKLGERPMDGTDLDAYYAHQCDIIPFTTPYNAAGAPAISLPLGWSADGLPVGVQFGAAMGNEGLLLRLASQIETAAPWATRRPG